MTVAADDAGEPAWFRRALENAPDEREHTVDGCRLRYRAWGKPDSPGLILIHGGGAHSGWWDHIAPLLDSCRVIAPDLSGHGDSAWRDGPDGYSASGWAGEIAAVAAAEGLDRPVVIGHSMGGFVAAATAAFRDTPLGGVIIIDTPLNDNPPEEAVLRQRRRPTRVYPSRDEAVARFRTVPEQDVLLPYVARHIARESLRPADGGWTWKFDPERRGTATPIRPMLPKISVPVALLRCEQGLLPLERAREMAGLAGGAPVITLPGTGHHPMLDQPLALVTALRSVLALWAAQTTRLPAPAQNGLEQATRSLHPCFSGPTDRSAWRRHRSLDPFGIIVFAGLVPGSWLSRACSAGPAQPAPPTSRAWRRRMPRSQRSRSPARRRS